MPIIDSLHLITVSDGNLGVRVKNNYRFPVQRFNLKYINYEYGGNQRTLRDITIENIAAGDEIDSLGEITSAAPIQFGDSLKMELYVELDITDNYQALNPTSATCPPLTKEEDGWVFNIAESFVVDLYFEIPTNSATNIICTTNSIEIDTIQTIPIEIPGIAMDIKGGGIKDSSSNILDNELN